MIIVDIPVFPLAHPASDWLDLLVARLKTILKGLNGDGKTNLTCPKSKDPIDDKRTVVVGT